MLHLPGPGSALESLLRSKRGHHNEKPENRDERTVPPPHSLQLEESQGSNRDSAQPKINNKHYI